MMNRNVWSVDAVSTYEGISQTLGDILVDENFIPEEFFIPEDELPKWQYEKGAKKLIVSQRKGMNMFSLREEWLSLTIWTDLLAL